MVSNEVVCGGSRMWETGLDSETGKPHWQASRTPAGASTRPSSVIADRHVTRCVAEMRFIVHHVCVRRGERAAGVTGATGAPRELRGFPIAAALDISAQHGVAQATCSALYSVPMSERDERAQRDAANENIARVLGRVPLSGAWARRHMAGSNSGGRGGHGPRGPTVRESRCEAHTLACTEVPQCRARLLSNMRRGGQPKLAAPVLPKHAGVDHVNNAWVPVGVQSAGREPRGPRLLFTHTHFPA